VLAFAIAELVDNAYSAVRTRQLQSSSGGVFQPHINMFTVQADEQSVIVLSGMLWVRYQHVSSPHISTVNQMAVVIEDNGIGMDVKGLEHMATYAHPPAHLTEQDALPAKSTASEHLRHALTAEISLYGKGAKQACFYLGDAISVITKHAGGDDVFELHLSKVCATACLQRL